MESSQPRQLKNQTMPLSNSEVIKLLRLHYSHKAQEEPNFVIGNEQGNELRKQTMDYIELFNEQELVAQVHDIRK